MVIMVLKVFKNHGASAGASLSHSHSQIIALPVVPSDVAGRIDSMKENFSRTGSCCLCHLPEKELVVSESAHFISYVPFAAMHPFEMWITPRDHSPHFHELDHDKVVRMLVPCGIHSWFDYVISYWYTAEPQWLSSFSFIGC